MERKIFTNDPKNPLPYKSTTINPTRTKVDIEELLHKYGIKKVAWNWDVENNKVELIFELSDLFEEYGFNPSVRISPPAIWKKKGRYDSEIDWRVSLRLLHWYIKNTLAWMYAEQSTKVIAFLPYVAVSKDKTLKDVIHDELTKYKALPQSETAAIIDAEATSG